MLKSIISFVEDLQTKGRYTFTQAEAMNADQRSDIALEAALRRLKQKGRIADPRRGFYVIVPVEYREAGCPPASWFIDDLMRDDLGLRPVAPAEVAAPSRAAG